MSTVKNVTLEPIDIGDGRLVAAGRCADRVDLERPAVEQHLQVGALLDVTEPDEPTARVRIQQIQSADPALLETIEASEQERSDPRKTVVDAIAARRAQIDNDTKEPSA